MYSDSHYSWEFKPSQQAVDILQRVLPTRLLFLWLSEIWPLQPRQPSPVISQEEQGVTKLQNIETVQWPPHSMTCLPATSTQPKSFIDGNDNLKNSLDPASFHLWCNGASVARSMKKYFQPDKIPMINNHFRSADAALCCSAGSVIKL